jgi:3-oxoacyl-[acyl-carrier protein] reductase
MTLAGRVAIVTGGSRGIGRATALALGREGADVVVNFVSRGDLAEGVVSEIGGMGRRARAIEADVGDNEAVVRMVEGTVREFGRLDILVNNAGRPSDRHRIIDVTDDEWFGVLRTNLTGAFFCTRAALGHLRRTRGAIVNISSNMTHRCPPVGSPYTVSKAGLEAFTRVLAKEEGKHHVRANVIAPGLIDTDMTQDVMKVDKGFQEYARTIPLNRLGNGADIAEMVVYLVSDRASYVTGQTFYVNGGADYPLAVEA